MLSHVRYGPFIPETSTKKLQGLQEMQARANSALSSSSIHLAVVTENSAANVHGMNKMLSSFLPEFQPPDCGENFTTFLELKNRLPWAWQSHAKGSGGHQTCQYRRQVLAIGANSIRGRLGHYRTGFRRPSQDRRHR
ncbi:MAG TPA: hypothetical protein VMA35_02730, partial [Candidatus Sulfopaludibacter sp.]|nr:hypothetical protein [Candidatus Sulfopaludibacter sp.]